MVKLGKRTVVRYYCGTLMYADLHSDKDLSWKYGEGLTAVGVKEFHTFHVHIRNDNEDFSCRIPQPWIFHALLSPLQSINDAWYLKMIGLCRLC